MTRNRPTPPPDSPRRPRTAGNKPRHPRRPRTATADLREAIKATAWRQIAAFGAPALSLRAIARELRITAPAIYNYFPRRDDLVTALIVEAFNSFGDSQLAARDSLPGGDPWNQLFAIGLAYRAWAFAYPQRYQLIFGAPIPDYQPSAEQIFPAGARAMTALVSTVEALRAAGRLRADGFPDLQPPQKLDREAWHAYAGPIPSISFGLAVLIWARVHGLVSLELSGSLPPLGEQGDGLYRYELANIGQQFFKELP
jgi:AcrR family transcriptional regulator